MSDKCVTHARYVNETCTTQVRQKRDDRIVAKRLTHTDSQQTDSDHSTHTKTVYRKCPEHIRQLAP